MGVEKNYLKYYRVIEKFFKVKYKIGEPELDIIIFLYDEPPFGGEKIKEYGALLKWNNNRVNDLMRDGWIVSYRGRNKRSRKMIYKLSYKSIKMVEDIYNYMDGKEIPIGSKDNPMFRRNVGYSDKVYKTMILKMNAATKRKVFGVIQDDNIADKLALEYY
jgi:DNA-binding MarR family transcriptional regulator